MAISPRQETGAQLGTSLPEEVSYQLSAQRAWPGSRHHLGSQSAARMTESASCNEISHANLHLESNAHQAHTPGTLRPSESWGGASWGMWILNHTLGLPQEPYMKTPPAVETAHITNVFGANLCPLQFLYPFCLLHPLCSTLSDPSLLGLLCILQAGSPCTGRKGE